MDSKIDNFNCEIRNIIKVFQLSSKTEITSIQSSLLRCYEAIKRLCYFQFEYEENQDLNHKDEIEKSLTILTKCKEELNEYLDFHFDVKRTEFDGFVFSGMNHPNYKITLDRVKIDI